MIKNIMARVPMDASPFTKLPEIMQENFLPNLGKIKESDFAIAIFNDRPFPEMMLPLNAWLDNNKAANALYLSYLQDGKLLVTKKFRRSPENMILLAAELVGGSICMFDYQENFTLSIISGDVSILCAQKSFVNSKFSLNLLSVDSLVGVKQPLTQSLRDLLDLWFFDSVNL